MQRGQIFRQGEGWGVRYYDGSGQRRRKGGFRIKREAVEWLDERLEEIRTGKVTQPDVTVDELVEEFLEVHAVNVTPRTLDGIRSNLRHLTRAFGSRRVSTLTTRELERWRAGLSEKSRHHYLGAAKQVLGYAERMGMIPASPAASMQNKQPARQELLPFTMEEVEAISFELPQQFRPMPLLLAGTGIMPQEFVALEWEDFDLKNRLLTVRRVLTKQKAEGWVLKHEGKTATRIPRTIPLRLFVVEAMQQHPRVLRQKLVFPSAGGGFYRRRGDGSYLDLDNFRTRTWDVALECAGVKPRGMYHLRHTYATWSLAAGVNLHALARRMGTSVQMIDKTYGHLAPNADEHEMQLLDSYDTKQGQAQKRDEGEGG